MPAKRKPAKKPKRPNPADLTLRNVRASNRRFRKVYERLELLELYMVRYFPTTFGPALQDLKGRRG